MTLEFESVAISWRGPAPFVFVPIPQELSDDIRSVSARITYGWGVIPVTVRIGKTEFTTSLFPKDGVYLVPVKLKVQRVEHVEVGEVQRVQVDLAL